MKYNVLTKEILLRSLGKSDAVTAVLPDEVIDYLCAAFEDPNTNDDVHELRDVVAPHLIDVSLLSAADAAVLDWLRGVVRQLVDAGVLENRVAGAGAGAQLLDAPVDIASTMDDADERNLFIDKEDRLGLVDQEQLKEKSEKYLKRKAERQAKQDRLDEKKKAASLEALRSIQEEQQKCKVSLVCDLMRPTRDTHRRVSGQVCAQWHHGWQPRHQARELLAARWQRDTRRQRERHAGIRSAIRSRWPQWNRCKRVPVRTHA
jgi:hypothetical protein